VVPEAGGRSGGRPPEEDAAASHGFNGGVDGESPSLGALFLGLLCFFGSVGCGGWLRWRRAANLFIRGGMVGGLSRWSHFAK
jgi:hypothetical protein